MTLFVDETANPPVYYNLTRLITATVSQSGSFWLYTLTLEGATFSSPAVYADRDLALKALDQFLHRFGIESAT